MQHRTAFEVPAAADQRQASADLFRLTVPVSLEESGLYGIGMEPSFAIGQRALLVTHPEGNVLWDCIPLIDDGLVEMVKGFSGISAIAIRHPHYYTSMVEWNRAFDCPSICTPPTGNG